MPITSRIEQIRDEIVAEFEDITSAGGYRTDPTVYSAIRPIDRIAKFPEIGVEIGDVSLEPIDNAWTVHNLKADIWVQGAVQADTDTGNEGTNINLAAEALRHDILRKIGEMLNKYMTHTATRWIVVVDGGRITCSTVQLFGERRNKGVFFARFQVLIRSTSNTILYEVDGGTDGPSATVVIDANG